MRFVRAFAPFATALLVGLAAPAVHGAQYAMRFAHRRTPFRSILLPTG